MRRLVAPSWALAMGLLLAPVGAQAFPGNGQLGRAPDGITLVREGCGPGWQWSNRRQMCVPDSPGAQYRDAMRQQYQYIPPPPPPRPVCPPYYRWSYRYQQCVAAY